jgi:paraquat-inducible protein A
VTEARIIDPELMACPECDLVLRRRTVPRDHDLECPRCRARLARRVPGGQRGTLLALVIAAAIVLASMLTQPLIGLERAGMETELSLSGMATAVMGSPPGWAIAGLVTLTLVAAPATFLALLLAVLLPASAHRIDPHRRRALVRIAATLRPWMMLEVFVISLGVALTKLGDLARVDYGLLLPALLFLVLLTTLVSILFDPHSLWDELGDRERMEGES